MMVVPVSRPEEQWASFVGAEVVEGTQLAVDAGHRHPPLQILQVVAVDVVLRQPGGVAQGAEPRRGLGCARGLVCSIAVSGGGSVGDSG
jgi:hypothetical protein